MTQIDTMVGLHFYAIVDAAGSVPEIGGINDEPVRAVIEESLAAVVSAAQAATLRPERRHLMAHQRVLTSLGKGRGVLPLRFGVVLSDEAKIRFILKTHQDELLRQLERVRGRVEMGLRVRWKEEEVFKNILDLYPALRQAREEMSKTREAAIEMGKRVADALADRRLVVQNLLNEIFAGDVVEFCFNTPKNDAQLINAACLIGCDDGAAFESAVHRLAARLDDRYLIDFTGPWTPHNFILLNMAMEGFS